MMFLRDIDLPRAAILSALLYLATALPHAVRATDYTAQANGNWSDDAVWTGSGYPDDAGDTATINGGYTITGDVSRTINALAIGSSAFNWRLYDNGGNNSLTTRTFNVDKYGILGSNLTVNVTNSGYWSGTDGNANFLNGRIIIQTGATFNLSVRLEGTDGTGIFNVQTGGTVTLSGNYINYNQTPSLTFNIDGVANFTSSGTLENRAKLFTGGGAWNINSGGTLNFSAGGSGSFALNPDTASWAGNTGAVTFSVSGGNGTNVLGAFTMGGKNKVTFSQGYNQINRASTFQNIDINGTATLDLNPAGAGVVTQTINGSLYVSGNAVQILKSSSSAGTVVNVASLTNSTANHFDIGSNVTFNLTGAGAVWGSYQDIYGVFNIKTGATFTIGSGGSNNRLRGNGVFNVEAGGTVNLDNHSINYYDGGASGMAFTNNGTAKFLYGLSFYPKTVAGAGLYQVTNVAPNFSSAGSIEGWSGSGAFNSLATWHVIGGSGSVDFPGGSANAIASIGTNATIIIEDGGKIVELNNSARNALTVYGGLRVRGTSNLAFNNNQDLTVAAGGTLGGNGTVTVGGTGKVNVQSGGTFAAVINGATADKLTVSGGNLLVAGIINVSYASAPATIEYCIASANAITNTAFVTGEAGWTAQVRNGGTELWLFKPGGTMFLFQ